MAIQLDIDTLRLIEKEVAAGRFPDAAAFVGAAVRHFLITREDLGYTGEQLDAMIAGAIASLEDGEGIDGEEFFASLAKEEGELQKHRK
jgi:Arc/MetJ-type ribon-helix-helix transcriptional regulator